MSHHLDAPQAAQNGQLYIDDLYVFSAGDSTVFMMDVNSTITEPNVKPGFHPEARYEFKVHRNGVAFEDLTYRVSFASAAADGSQAVQVHELTGEDARSDAATGTLLVEGRTGQAAGDNNIRLWAGRIADSFYIDLSLLFKVNAAVKDGTAPDLSAVASRRGAQQLRRHHGRVDRARGLPPDPALRPGTPIGVWCATKLATDAGGWRQINRAGHPMMWPIFWPDDTEFTYPANTRHPSEDRAAIGDQLAKQIAAVVGAVRSSDDPQGYGAAVAATLLPDVLPYVVGTPASYGFAGLQRPEPGRQRPRGHAVPGHRHGHPLRTEAVRRGAPPGAQLPLRRPRLIHPDRHLDARPSAAPSPRVCPRSRATRPRTRGAVRIIWVTAIAG